MTDKNFYVTTSIFYVNGSPHIGHAYEALLADVIARFKRLDGYDVRFQTGTDEYGKKNAEAAEKREITPQEYCDNVSSEMKEMHEKLNISFDVFMRTTSPEHHKAAQGLWNAIKENNPDDIYLDEYEGWYSTRDEAYFGEDEITINEDGERFAPSGAKLEWMKESSYFFRLSNYAEKLLELYKTHPEFIAPKTRRNEIISFVKSGLRDLSISRTSFNWGVPVPDDPDHVMYVWIDALTNYMTGVGYPDTQDENYKKYWPADHHIIGKDIIRFHCIYWPAFLMAAGLEPAKQVFAHGFINIDGQKMSKSLGNVIAPDHLLETYGLDQTRYILMREFTHSEDGSFSHPQAVQRINCDLANGLGNLVQRTVSMAHKNCLEKIPEPGPLQKEDEALLYAFYECLPELRQKIDKMEFHRALELIWRLVAQANIYIDAQAPWTLRKTDEARMNTVLYVLMESIRCLGILTQPFMPDSASKILDLLSIDTDKRAFDCLNSDHALKSGVAIEKPQGLFPRIEAEDQERKTA